MQSFYFSVFVFAFLSARRDGENHPRASPKLPVTGTSPVPNQRAKSWEKDRVMRNEKLTPASWPHVGRASQLLCRLADSQTLRERLLRCKTELIHDTRSCMECSLGHRKETSSICLGFSCCARLKVGGWSGIFQKAYLQGAARAHSEWSL